MGNVSSRVTRMTCVNDQVIYKAQLKKLRQHYKKKKKKSVADLAEPSAGRRSETFAKSFGLTGDSLAWVVCDRKCVVRCIFKFCDSDPATEATSKPCVVSCPSG